MQFSKLVLLSITTLTSSVLAAPAIVTVTRYVDINDPAATAAAAAAPLATPTTATLQPTPSSSANSTEGLSDNAILLLVAHNNRRGLHKDTPLLSWSKELETYAQNYADSFDCSGQLTHSGGPYGENLALGYGIEGAVKAWYDEIDQYDYNNQGFSELTGHFTQLIWKDTTEVGCAVKYCGETWGDYVVCSYNPAGNVIGEFNENVLPLIS